MFRRTEKELEPVNGITPKSVFQLAWPGQVGTGSLRGMSFLTDLLDAGFSVWPFQEPTCPMVVEIYPRMLTYTVVKRSHAARKLFLDSPEFASFPKEWRTAAEESEDAFDAAVSAFVMNKHFPVLKSLRKATDPDFLPEGTSWNQKRSN